MVSGCPPRARSTEGSPHLSGMRLRVEGAPVLRQAADPGGPHGKIEKPAHHQAGAGIGRAAERGDRGREHGLRPLPSMWQGELLPTSPLGPVEGRVSRHRALLIQRVGTGPQMPYSLDADSHRLHAHVGSGRDAASRSGVPSSPTRPARCRNRATWHYACSSTVRPGPPKRPLIWPGGRKPAAASSSSRSRWRSTRAGCRSRSHRMRPAPWKISHRCCRLRHTETSKGGIREYARPVHRDVGP